MILKNVLKKSKNFILFFIYHKDENNLLSILEAYDVVSFDIFDTLIDRTCKKPDDIFDYVQVMYNLQNPEKKLSKFKTQRKKAYKNAVKKSKFEEVTLKEIYDNLENYTKKEKEKLKGLEIKLELSLCKTNIKMHEIYLKLLKDNKQIIVTSDMYLPLEIIEEILKKNGYTQIKKIFLSSELKLTKWTGSIYKKIVNLYRGKKIIHIGDNPTSDYIRARNNGIDAFLINSKNNYNYLKVGNKTIKQELLNQIISAKMCYSDIYSQFGYRVFGPLLFGFVSWLNNELNSNNINKVCFLARDAKIVKMAYEILYGNKSKSLKYLNISRKSIILSELDGISSFDELYESLKSILKKTASVNELYQLIGISENLYSNKLIIELSLEEKNEIFHNIKPSLELNAKKQKDLFSRYLKQNKFNEKVALVDIGWRGTIQYLLSKKCPNTDIYGFYFGVNLDKNFKEMEVLNRNGYLFNSSFYNPNQSVISLNVGIFEVMFLAQEGTTLFYKDLNNKVYPILDKEHKLEKNVVLIQNAALSFIKNVKEKKLDDNILRYFSVDDFFSNFKYIATKPKYQVINMFKKIEFEGHNKQNLVSNKSFIYYFFHIKEFLIDFNNSYCKVIFLKNVFKIPLPYYSLLNIIYKKSKV